MWTMLAAPALGVSAPQAPTAAVLSWPVKGRPLGHLCHGCEEVEIAATAGSPVTAIADGAVIFVGVDPPANGQRLLVRHEDGAIASYGGLESVAIKVGERIRQGQILGAVCSPNGPRSARLRFGMRRTRVDGAFEVIDPIALLPRR